MAAKMAKPNLSVQKTIKIIEILAHSVEPMRLTELAAKAELPDSTALRMVNTLVDSGYAYQEESMQRRYGLTLRFTQIGQLVASHFSIRDIAHPYLVALTEELGECCCLSIEDNQQVRYLDVVENHQTGIAIRQQIGGTASMHCTGSGKAFLSQYSAEQLHGYVDQMGLPRLTSHTITTYNRLTQELQTGLENGYFTDNEECEIGMRCISVPILDAGKRICAALSLSGPIARMTEQRCELIMIPMLRSYAQQITEKVGGIV